MSLKVFSATITLLFFCASAQGWAVDDYGCRTPDLDVGDCIPVRDCKIMVDFLQRVPKPIPSHVKEKLREYTCGFRAGEIKVCCPSKPLPEMLSHMKMPEEPTTFEDDNKLETLNLIPKECGYMGIPDKISNGENAKLGEYPWMALLSYKTNNGQRFLCGGTVINDRYILTAAHCITQLGKDVTLTGVRVGDYDISKEVDCELQPDGSTKCIKEPVQNLSIEKVIPHPNFTSAYNNADGFNDIGLLRVTPMKFADNVQPICLPNEETKDSTPKRVIIAGWGYVKNKTRSDILQKVTVPLISQKSCQEAYKRTRISDKQICADGRNKDTCKGDSGGPLQTPMFLNEDIRLVQYGIISGGGLECGSGSQPGVYTRVDSYMDWILSNIKP